MVSINSDKPKRPLKQQIIILAGIALLMFGFCYALVPLYNVFCQVTGINGKTDGRPQPLITKIDHSRQVTVELVSTLNQDTPNEFAATDKKFTLHPGEYVKTTFRVKNLTDKPQIVQAIPSVTPGQGARHIKKVECFCFKQQELAPNEEADLPLKFTVDPALPHKIKTMTLAYTLFDVTKQDSNKDPEKNAG